MTGLELEEWRAINIAVIRLNLGENGQIGAS
jgi:hypothetical protein